MKKGDIVRQTMFDRGGLIGPYMRIEYIEHNRVYCSVLNSDTPNKLVLGNRLKKIPSMALEISDQDMKKIKDRNLHDLSISHPITKTWMRVHESTVSIIKFYTNKRECYYTKLYFSAIKKPHEGAVVKLYLERL